MNSRLTKKRVKNFDLKIVEQKEAYESVLNDPMVTYIIKEEFAYDRRTGHPVVTIWFEEYIR